MAGLVIVICLLMLIALFVVLRYEGNAERESRHGELREPLQTGIWRGIKEDVRNLLGRLRKA